MYMRVTSALVPPDKVNASIDYFKKNVLPRVRRAPGNVGVVLLVDRQTGESFGTTCWESARAQGAAEQVSIETRTQSPRNVPGTQIINVERFEVALFDSAAAPEVGNAVLLTSGTVDPGKLVGGIGQIRDHVLPVARAQKGYRATVVAFDRQADRLLWLTVWDDRALLDASENPLDPPREDAARVLELTESLRRHMLEAAAVDMTGLAK